MLGPKMLLPVKVLLPLRPGIRAVFKLSVTLPEVPPPVSPVPAVTPVIVPIPVPVPGKVCPAAKWMVPLVLKYRPVSVGVDEVVEARRLKVAPGEALLLLIASAWS